jgi:hypothetical protein
MNRELVECVMWSFSLDVRISPEEPGMMRAGEALLLPNPRLAEEDEYLTNSHIFHNG